MFCWCKKPLVEFDSPVEVVPPVAEVEKAPKVPEVLDEVEEV